MDRHERWFRVMELGRAGLRDRYDGQDRSQDQTTPFHGDDLPQDSKLPGLGDTGYRFLGATQDDGISKAHESPIFCGLTWAKIHRQLRGMKAHIPTSMVR